MKILFWLGLASLSIAGLVLLFFHDDTIKKNVIPACFSCLLFVLFCAHKIHFLISSRSSYRRGDWKLQELDEISGLDFEELTCDILASNGFELAQNTRSTGDFGVDVLAYRDGISFAIQCKRYHSDVGIEAVQQVYAGRAFYECHVAMVLTNQYFTPAARELADKIGVVLWDRDMLESLL
jgi:restriction system protein